MSLNRLVIGMGILGLATASVPAMELVDGFTLSGYGEAFAQSGHRDRNSWRNESGSDEWYLHFPSDMAIKVDYRVDEFRFHGDLLAFSQEQFGNTALLEQAFVDWRSSSVLTMRAGRFQTTWLGWEGFHTPELWRVNHSAAWDWNVQNHGLGPARPFVTDGIGALLSVPDVPFTAQFFIADDLLGDAPGQKPSDKAVGASFAYKPKGVGRVELGLGFDPNSSVTRNGTGSNSFAIDVNADITAFQDRGWFFAGEIQVHRHPKLWVAGATWGSDLIALAMANYAFMPGKASATLMIDYVERGFSASNNEVLEIAFAVLTRPHRQVLLNGEVFVWDERAKDADSVGAAAVVLVNFP
ncbi:MAG: hypothetical protein H0V44_06750 [Planctomycetes bacterium]|nr:hypothetical protein [Planctomycetota bacterium]